MEQPSYEELSPIITMALQEDIGSGDITSLALFDEYQYACARISSKNDGIFCGGFLIEYIYHTIDPAISVTIYCNEGAAIKKDDVVCDIEGSVRALLSAERTVLNFLQRTCGIATRTARLVSLVSDTPIKIFDTRKTVPGFRLLDKYAVYCGGGTNHRMGLFDMILIKDNHIKAAGGIQQAVMMVRQKYANRYTIEVEVETLNQVHEAVEAGVDIIMLDNMTKDRISLALSIINGKAKVEVSGNMDEHTLKEIADLPVDYVSVGALTHSVKAFDLTMRLI
ncbi:MAG TPA: carboxylating nicotinate-nucleotide diphosphorylase [Spirochaetota bacterium]|nr:carboxylating nicotinate-nucleotide diphosphorylase [Spirochaetota bacterium]HOM86930.1 carboxylating nicotinate-nucleotide diphosphorylase [Spirochaetota bacterium]HOR94096.1 carboxylating nicotinate-nucleotide diphosphorylase [Spirochaetota bacterium]HOT18680.1 carboxylating nicotinate-nucleotide diphosphorylase [Spirochaetota bacterium]HPD04616.1 carboxylating nicotinate-nucleotide diphosphorylase [Spirochaetota bacterium]